MTTSLKKPPNGLGRKFRTQLPLLGYRRSLRNCFYTISRVSDPDPHITIFTKYYRFIYKTADFRLLPWLPFSSSRRLFSMQYFRWSRSDGGRVHKPSGGCIGGYHLAIYLFDLLKQTDLNEYLESNIMFLENIVVFRKACFNNNNEL